MSLEVKDILLVLSSKDSHQGRIRQQVQFPREGKRLPHNILIAEETGSENGNLMATISS